MIDTAEAAISHNSKPGLPRLGTTTTASLKTKEVELEDAGASLVLRKPSVAAILEIQSKVDFDKADMREMYAGTVGLISRMLVDPELTVEQLRAHTDELTFGDWQHLQEEALELAGLGGETRQQAQAAFREPGEP